MILSTIGKHISATSILEKSGTVVYIGKSDKPNTMQINAHTVNFNQTE